MKTTISTAILAAALVLPGLAAAQPMTSQGAPGGRPGAPDGDASRLGGSKRDDLMAPGRAPGAGKPPRPERAIGPDLMAYVFAPIGVIVAPITDGIHHFDAAIAPLDAVLAPITGPVDPNLFASPAPAAPDTPPAGRGPRK